ncbi:CPBP family intramembrane glutamic endopeptidase [Gulosibacter molinativorax]|uniref:CPBP family intramembrane metalloprotease n=1 Tax=Gulosibacter molinativorax TaxID=256821 RepID=A0ABT7C8R6_9MICO|nr:CPBP family intramembrane glutamic endopeptidase [Gulosibacter molinativorax]MDJ1371490.1 CPBP family intramembrane metalloprotease [Gulosibacter molinativorax]QUY62429.1 Putative metal-dependent membrane protease [Gulosibacter molinativorax]
MSSATGDDAALNRDAQAGVGAEGLAWGILAVRIGSIAVVTVVAWLVLAGLFDTTGFPPSTIWATLGLLPVNLLCLWLLRRLYRREGMTLRDALGIRRGKVGRDILWGLLWLVVMNVPFAVAVAGTVFLLYGADAPAAFETIFVNPEAESAISLAWLLVIAIVSVIPFMLINAPTEELVYRGYAMSGIARRRGGAVAVIATSLVFGVQHMAFAATVPGMLVFLVAFTLWGAAAALIVRWQGRLFPVVVAHWIINFMLSSPGIVFPILQLAGVIEAE